MLLKNQEDPPEYVIDKMAEEKGNYINKPIHRQLKYLQNVNEQQLKCTGITGLHNFWIHD